MNETVMALERIRKLFTFWCKAVAELEPLCGSEEIRKMYDELDEAIALVAAKELKVLMRHEKKAKKES